MNNTKKLVMAGLLIAIGTVCSAFYIPIGVSKCFPVQHMINVLAGIILGPFYAVAMAFLTSFIRIMLGTGTLLAFPGSMCGAFLCGIMFKHTGKKFMAFIGEVIGTGVIGALLAYPAAVFFMGREVALFAYIIPFSLSSFGGAIVAYALVIALSKTPVWQKI